MFNNIYFNHNFKTIDNYYSNWIPVKEIKYNSIGKIRTYNADYGSIKEFKSIPATQLLKLTFDEWRNNKMNRPKEDIIKDLEEYLKPIESERIGIGWSNKYYSRLDLNTPKKITIKDNDFVNDLFYLSVNDEIQIALCIPVEYERYYKLCFLTGEFPDLSVAKLFINSNLDTPRTPYKSLRKHYRTILKPLIAKYDFNIELVPSVNDIVYYFPTFKFKTISEKKQYFQSIYSEYQRENNIFEEKLEAIPF